MSAPVMRCDEVPWDMRAFRWQAGWPVLSFGLVGLGWLGCCLGYVFSATCLSVVDFAVWRADKQKEDEHISNTHESGL